MTGWAEAGAVGIIEKTGPEDEHRFYMFVKEKNKQEELWDGPRNGVAAAEDVFNADEVGFRRS